MLQGVDAVDGCNAQKRNFALQLQTGGDEGYVQIMERIDYSL